MMVVEGGRSSGAGLARPAGSERSRQGEGASPIQLLAIFTLTALPLAVWYAHNHAVRKHRDAMMSLFIGALGVAGVFTSLAGHIIHAAAVVLSSKMGLCRCNRNTSGPTPASVPQC
jgi:hypothetical protein